MATTEYHIREVAPDNWALCYGSQIEIEDMPLDIARQVLDAVTRAEEESLAAAQEAQADAERARESEQDSREKFLEEIGTLHRALVMYEDPEVAIDTVTHLRAISDAVEAFARDVLELQRSRAPNKVGTRCPVWMRQRIEEVLRTSGSALRKLTYVKPDKG